MLEIENVSKDFGGITAIDEVSFSIEENEVVGLIGPNGAGKTTLFNLITGFLDQPTGQIRFDGEDITNEEPHNLHTRGLARTFQDARVYPNLTVYENLIISAPLDSTLDIFSQNVPDRYIERAETLLEIAELSDLRYNKGQEISFGQQKLTEFATLFMSDPKLAMLDEPCGGVNPSIIQTFKEYIADLNNEGYTFFIIEHNMDFAMDVCERIIVLDQGSVLADGTPDEIRQNQAVLDAYLGEEQA
jgi:neutral amino acid transport system ATP-binding protein